MRIRKTLWNNDAEPIIVIMVILMVLGTINVFSSSFVLATTDFDNPYYFLTRHAIWLVVGLAAFVFCRKVNYQRWRLMDCGIGGRDIGQWCEALAFCGGIRFPAGRVCQAARADAGSSCAVA